MGIKRTDITELYYQLSVLARASMPLPETLGRIAETTPNLALRKTIVDIAARTARGDTLSSALTMDSRLFPRFHLQLIAIGEQTDTLPELLGTVARLARLQEQLTAKMRAAISYPLLVFHVACIGALFFAWFVAPGLSELMWMVVGIDDHGLVSGLGGELSHHGLPPLSYLVFRGMSWMGSHSGWLICAYIALVALSLWMLSSSLRAHRVFLRLVDILPGTWHIVRSLDATRIATMWGLFLQRGIPLSDATAQVARLIECGPTAQALARVADRIRQGATVAGALEPETRVDPLIRLTFQHTPENAIADELVALGTLYGQRTEDAIVVAEGLWTAVSIVVIALFVGSLVIGFFLPLTNIISNLSG